MLKAIHVKTIAFLAKCLDTQSAVVLARAGDGSEKAAVTIITSARVWLETRRRPAGMGDVTSIHGPSESNG